MSVILIHILCSVYFGTVTCDRLMYRMFRGEQISVPYFLIVYMCASSVFYLYCVLHLK